jgi:hypothetical protein
MGKEGCYEKKAYCFASGRIAFGCHKLDSGIVIKKYFAAGHYENYTTVISTGKTVIPVAGTRYVHDKWYVTIEGDYRGKIRQEDFSIPESEFKNLNVGDFIRVREAYGKE